MSTYPITVLSQHFNHQGGTKSYHVSLISTNDGRYVVVNRWGRTGELGQLKAEIHQTKSQAETAFNTKVKEKTRGGYRFNNELVKDAANAQELVKIIGLGVFNKMGAAAISHLDPAIDTSRMRQADPPTVDENGNKIDTARRVDISKAVEEQRRADQAAAEAALKSNPIFGMF